MENTLLVVKQWGETLKLCPRVVPTVTDLLRFLGGHMTKGIDVRKMTRVSTKRACTH